MKKARLIGLFTAPLLVLGAGIAMAEVPSGFPVAYTLVNNFRLIGPG